MNVEYVSALHQLFKFLKPSFNDLVTSDIEDVFLSLEETDENFHRYDLVKNLRKSLEISMGQIIDYAVEKRSGTRSEEVSMSGHESFVNMITQEASNSQIFIDLIKDICEKSTSAGKVLLKHLNDEFDDECEDDASEKNKQMRSILSEVASTTISTLNQGIFFISQGEFHSIAREIDMTQDAKTRYNALQRLCRVPPSDVMASENWSDLCVSLMDALADNDPLIANKALSFHAKMFAVASHQILRETHSCLIGHLTKCIQTSSFKSIDNGVDLQVSGSKQLIKKYRLLKEFYYEVPSIWVRFPENFIERVSDGCFNLLATQKNTALSAFNIFSLLDPKASWFRRWLHGNYNRSIIIKTIREKYHCFFQDLVNGSLDFCKQICLKQSKSREKSFKRLFYSSKHIFFLNFIQSSSILSQLLNYSHGRNLIASIPNISIQEVLINWIKVLETAKFRPRTKQKSFELAAVIGKELTYLCLSEAFVMSCIDDDVITHLLIPVQKWMNKQVDDVINENAMLYIAEVISSISSTTIGRKRLLTQKIPTTKSASLSAADVLAQFSSLLLREELIVKSGDVTAAFVFICRQIYSTCSGLSALDNYNLHTDIANAWKKASDESDDDVTDVQSALTYTTSKHQTSWKEALLDNLLNFAATPQGILLLQQTKVMDEAVAYMNARYTKKLQVSRCEKFGYGVMVTQIASSSAGISALSKAGYIEAVIKEIWRNLEFASDVISTSCSLPPVERYVQKPFLNLINLFNTYPAVHEIFSGVPLANRDDYVIRDTPQTAVDLIDRLIVLNSSSKSLSLLNFNQSCSFALRLLTALSCNLDTWLLLETQYKLEQALLQAQHENTTPDNHVIVDEMSIERNHLLVRVNLIGSSTERSLPQRSLPSDLHFISSSPLATDYVIKAPTMTSSHVKRDNSLVKFLNKSKSSEKNRSWLEELQKNFVEAIIKGQMTTNQLLVEVVEKAMTSLERLPDERLFKRSTSSHLYSAKDSLSVSDVIKQGVKLAVRYGRHVMALKSSVESCSRNLIWVLMSCRKLLAEQQIYTDRYSESTSCDCDVTDASHAAEMTSGPYPCHDWFVSSMFLMMNGNKDKTFSFLFRFSQLSASGFLWPARFHASIHLKDEVRSSSVYPIYCCIGHQVEKLLQVELPLIYSTFRMCGFTASQISVHWLTQCFWNYLPWKQICLYISLVVVMGADYQVYVCIAVLKSLQENIFAHRQTQDLQLFLRENSLDGFEISEWITYMQKLEEKHKSSILKDLKKVIKIHD